MKIYKGTGSPQTSYIRAVTEARTRKMTGLLPEPSSSQSPQLPASPESELTQSAIHPSFIGTAIQIAPDIEIDPVTHEVIATPLDDALGKKYRRFGRQSTDNEQGFILWNEDNSCWQVKRSGQYLAPKNNGNRAYLPPIPDVILRKICDRHQLDFIITQIEIAGHGSFWTWVELHPELPIVPTEGGKKALAALSQGYIAIALYGCTCGRSPDLQPFLSDGRSVTVAFDSDTKPTAKRAVIWGINILQSVIGKGTSLHVAQWEPEQGKGLDDLIAQSGVKAFEDAIASAKTFAAWRAKRSVQNPLGIYQPHLRVNVPCLGAAIAPETVPNTGTVVLYAGMGTGKTKLIAKLLENAPGAIAPGHSIGLQRGLSNRLKLNYIDDCDFAHGYILGRNGQPTNRVGLCWDSLLKIPLRAYPDRSYDLVLDELDQGLRHLLYGATCGKGGLRPGLMKRAIALIRGARRVICASATLSWWDIELIAKLRNEQPWILQNDYQHDRFPVSLYTGGTREHDLGAVLVRLRAALDAGQRVMVVSDEKLTVKALGLWAELEPEQILTYHAHNSGELDQRWFAAGPDAYLSDHPKLFTACSPSLTSGVSIEQDHFDLVFGLFFGQTITPADALQQLGRLRQPVERVVWCAAHGRGNPERWAAAYQKAESKRAKTIANLLGEQLPLLDENNPISDYLASSGARRNLEMANFGAFLQARLAAAGHSVTIPTRDRAELLDVATTYRSFLDAKGAARELEVEDRHCADIIDDAEAQSLRDKRVLSYKEACKLERHDIADFLAIAPEDLELEDIWLDRRGKYRRQVTRLECLMYKGMAHDKDAALLTGLKQWKSPILGHDLPHHQLQSEGAIALGLPDLVMHCINSDGYDNRTDWAINFAEFAQARRDDIRIMLGFSIHPNMTPCQIIGMCLRSWGITTNSTRTTTDNGKRARRYTLDRDNLGVLMSVLQRRAARHKEQGVQVRPHPLINHLLGGVASSPPEADQLSPWMTERGAKAAALPPPDNLEKAIA